MTVRVSAFFRQCKRGVARYPWTAIVAFLTGILLGATAIVNPILWVAIIGAALVGRLTVEIIP